MLTFLRSIFKFWKRLGKLIAKIITWVVLFLFYFLVIGLFAIFIRWLLGRDLLNKRFMDTSTFWSNREKQKMDLKSCRQQF